MMISVMAITSPSIVTISDTAREQLKGLIADQPADRALGLRVFIQSGGCSGFSYGMGLDENPPKEDDQVVDVDGGIKVYVDAYSSQYLQGAEIDYVDEMMGGGFTIHNPNAVETCGCGTSFQTADGAGEGSSCHCRIGPRGGIPGRLADDSADFVRERSIEFAGGHDIDECLDAHDIVGS